jgi:hypothetical protein
MGNVVIFGAAIPGQGGTGHINEQWPEYWIDKFSDNGFDVFDIFRKEVRANDEVAPWYAQNCFLFIQKDDPLVTNILASGFRPNQGFPLRAVHPGILRLAACESAGAMRLIRALPGRVIASLSHRFRF